jgi:O-methyltransferase involved in polyketide biosynthesis
MTALGAAALRAVHLVRDGNPKILDDAFALKLLGWSEDDVLAFVPESFSVAAWVTRARVAEDLVAAAYERGTRQYVLLGAGLDSFALRQADAFEDLVVFEVDDPPRRRSQLHRHDRRESAPDRRRGRVRSPEVNLATKP